MDIKQIASFVKIEHTLFSLPFVFIGAYMAGDPTYTQLAWILVAAVGARGLAMGLNRIIDREIDAANPRTATRHLASGSMSLSTAWILCGVFLLMLVGGAWMLNPLCLYLSPIPVAAFVIYPYLKRYTWLCHWWLGGCLALAPAGAWVAITGEISSKSWYPDLLFVSLGVLIWISSFDLGYAQMDIESDRENGIKSFPANFQPPVTMTVMLMSTPLWAAAFSIVSVVGTLISLALVLTVLSASGDQFQKWWFRAHVSTGWILLIGMQLS
ncbi:MAG: 4-hydroxybenzoate octaprenyltransferase [Candidatus Poseidoniales archaeon]|nr:MAG: 4-hydroxybenzoate octaprenyltransferase [Candidatus Poseidoniales archaeon]